MKRELSVCILLAGITYSAAGQSERLSFNVNAGAREFEGEGDAYYKGPGRRFTPWYQMGIYYKLNPAYGIRMNLGGYAMKGYALDECGHLFYDKDGKYLVTDFPLPESCRVEGGWFEEKIRYVDLSVMMFTDIRKIFGYGMKPDSWDIRFAAGLSYAHVFHYMGIPKGDFLNPCGSLILRIPLWNEIYLELEGNATLTPNGFTGEIGESRYTGYWGLGAGISIPLLRTKQKN